MTLLRSGQWACFALLLASCTAGEQAGVPRDGGDDSLEAPAEHDAAFDDDSAAAALPWPARALGAAPHPADNVPSDEKRSLGRLLFYDPLLSSDRATACVTCHSEIWGLGDQLRRSVGVEGKGPIGPARVGPNLTRRNAQPLWNLAYRSVFFWDGRASSLEEQVLFPFAAPEELNRPIAEVVSDLRANAQYQALFERAFPEAQPAVSEATLSMALASFVRAYVSVGAPYDRFLAGDEQALSAQDLRGIGLFAELRCHTCHEPPRFDSDQYADRKVPNPENIVDLGRFEVTSGPRDRHAFRVPTLRNARETGPFFHNGAVRTFEEAVRHEVDVQLDAGAREPLTEQEFSDLLAFLRRSLSDVSRLQHPPKVLPSGLPLPPDGDRLLRGGHEP